MKLILASLLASASLTPATLPNPSILTDQTVAQAHAKNVAEHYAAAATPKQQAASEPSRDEEYRRIQEDMQKWFPCRRPLEPTSRDFKMRWHGVPAAPVR
jgi:predicted component of type VI protein secretion system